MDKKHAIVRTDNMTGTTDGSQLRSVKYFENDKPAAIDNGHVVKVETLMEGSREVYKAVAPTADAELKDVVLVATPELMYDERKRNLDEFENEEGEVARGYHLCANNIFSVTEDAFDGVPKVGQVVELGAGTKLVTGAAPGSGTKVGVIVDSEKTGTKTFYAVRVA